MPNTVERISNCGKPHLLFIGILQRELREVHRASLWLSWSFPSPKPQVLMLLHNIKTLQALLQFGLPWTCEVKN